MDNFNKNYAVCTLENVLSYTVRNFCTYIKYLISNLFNI